MIDDLPLRWVVTGLFLLSGVGFALVTDRRSWTSVVSYGLHLMMAIAMAAMAGRRARAANDAGRSLLRGGGPVVRDNSRPRHPHDRDASVRGYHALMMLAMAWMYAVAHQHPHAGGIGRRAPHAAEHGPA